MPAERATPPGASDRHRVFISAKSADYEYARRVYEVLTAAGVPTFFSQESLPELGSSDYRREIDRALDEVEHMVVVASSAENVLASWVEAEWGLFINEKRSGRKRGNLVTIVVGGLRPAELPPSLRYYEVIPFEQGGPERLLRYLTGGGEGAHVAGSGAVDRAVAPPRTFRETATFGEPAPSVCLAVDPSGRLVASGGIDGAVRIWDLEARNRKALLGSDLYWAMRHESLVKAIAFDPGGRYVATGHHHGVAHIWDIEEEEEFGGMRHREGEVAAVAFSGDGRTLATGGKDAFVQLWDVAALREGDTRPGLLRLVAPVAGLTYLEPGGRLLSGQVNSPGGRSIIQVHDGTKARELVTLRVPALFSALAVSSDQKRLAAGMSDGSVGIFDLQAALGDLTEAVPARDLVPTRSFTGHRKAVTSVALVFGGALAVSAAMEPKMIVWDVASGERTMTFRGAHNEVFASVAALRDGATILALLADGRIRLWEAV